MKVSFFTMLSATIMFLGCEDTPIRSSLLASTPEPIVGLVPDTTVQDTVLFFNRMNSTWLLDNQLYSGYAVSHYPDGTQSSRAGFLNGKKHGCDQMWYPDGHLKQIVSYHLGKPHGEKKKWAPEPDHVLISHYQYENGKPHGEQLQWYPTSELFKRLNMEMGREEGIQQAYRKNGVVYANYEARNGRIYGMKKTKLCYGLEDEVVQYVN